MIFERIRQASMKAAMSPTTMKILSDPRIQKVMMRAIRLPTEVRDVLEKNGQNIAKTFSLVTKEDLATMKRTIRDLQSTVEQLSSQLERERDVAVQTKATPKPETGGNGDLTHKTQAGSVPRKKKITVKRAGSKSTAASASAAPKKKKITVKRAAAKAEPASTSAAPQKKKITVKRKSARTTDK